MDDEPEEKPRRRWPKGPFPDKYRWAGVAARLAGAWESERGAHALARLGAHGLAPHPTEDDPHARVFVGPAPDTGALQRELRPLGVTVYAWLPHSARDGEGGEADRGSAQIAIGAVASDDPLDAIACAGVAGPKHGIGATAVARFAMALRHFASESSPREHGRARFAILAMGEDRLRIDFLPRDGDAARTVAARVLELCPGMARAGTTVDALAERMLREHALDLDWR